MDPSRSLCVTSNFLQKSSVANAVTFSRKETRTIFFPGQNIPGSDQRLSIQKPIAIVKCTLDIAPDAFDVLAG